MSVAKAVAQESKMNKTEGRYSLWLRTRRDRGEIKDFILWGVSLRLADGARYTPDFLVVTNDDEIECHEVKGHWREAARVRIKVAAGKYPFRFIAIQESKGGYIYENFTDPNDSRITYNPDPLEAR